MEPVLREMDGEHDVHGHPLFMVAVILAGCLTAVAFAYFYFFALQQGDAVVEQAQTAEHDLKMAEQKFRALEAVQTDLSAGIDSAMSSDMATTGSAFGN
jgi:hypothetical protein